MPPMKMRKFKVVPGNLNTPECDAWQWAGNLEVPN
jgi:hypothetical protein